MFDKTSVKADMQVQSVDIINGEMELEVVVKVRFAMPEQTRDMPNKMEEIIEECGQQYKRGMYKYVMEVADEELVKSKRESVEFNRIGKTAYTIKALFGKVIIDRIRVRNKQGGSQIPSCHAWVTGQQVYTTTGLKAAVCDLVVKESVTSTLAEIEKRAGEIGLLSSRTVLNILHLEGSAIINAQERRAEAIYESMPAARGLIIESNNRVVKSEFDYSDEEEELIGGRVIWNWEAMGIGDEVVQSSVLSDGEGRITYYESKQRTAAEGLVICQLDEVKVPAQEGAGRKEIWLYTGVVNAGSRSYYFSAESANKLFYQVGALLAVLGVHKGRREVYIIGDGARWIRNWYLDLPIARKSIALCWFHLASRCHEQMSVSFGKELGWQLEKTLLDSLWRGDVEAAIKGLTANKDRLINPASYHKLIRYLRARQPFITNYELRRIDEQSIASTRVEKLNDWGVATRCKGQGRTWGYTGVKSVAALVVARRNGELDLWRHVGELPKWEASFTFN